MEAIELMVPHATMKNIVIAYSFELEQFEIMMDKNRIKQVLVNIINNAIEAMPNGGSIDIGLRIIDKQAVSICIRDTGPGISDEVLQRIGEPFFTTKTTGTGLGIMVSRKIIESHHGRFQIHSRAFCRIRFFTVSRTYIVYELSMEHYI
ncbi:ATP-binding protein [Alicyclobacillus acidoterrestris]|uniref:ATP-binding protein n=1 Tax=Alicyclobacillus acidoterrestris TaxID=1450 RepID=UPI003F535B72